MGDAHWLTVLGLGEDGPEGLPPASLAALKAAEIIIGPPRHLSLLPETGARKIAWPVPFADGVDLLETLRGQQVVALASGDPFWFGAGRVIAARFAASEWRALPAPSTFSHAAARMGWGLEQVTCLGLHAAPLTRLRPYLSPGARLIVLLRDGSAVGDLCAYLDALGWGESTVTAMQALAGLNERVAACLASAPTGGWGAPVCAAIEVAGDACPVTLATGRSDALFAHDGQMTKRPMRALTLSALAPRRGEMLWDIGGGSGSVAIEWLLCAPSLRAISFEANPTRAARIVENAQALGVDRLQVVEGRAPEALQDRPLPDAVFIGGGLSAELLADLAARLRSGTRLVANAVTLESQALLIDLHARQGGDLMRVDLADATPLGRYRGWQAAYPALQYSGQL